MVSPSDTPTTLPVQARADEFKNRTVKEQRTYKAKMFHGV